MLRSANPRKATGTDRLPGKVFRACADQLTPVCTNIFYQFLLKVIIPRCLKSATIIPIPKTSLPISLNDYLTVALTPVIMKCFERMVLYHIKASLPSTFDEHQFTYRMNRFTESPGKHGNYVRMLFIDYSSAFLYHYPGHSVQ